MASIKDFTLNVFKKKQPLPQYLSSVINYINLAHEAISGYKLDKNATETPKEVIELLSITKHLGDYILAFSKGVNQFKPIYCAISQDIIIKDLEFIKNDTQKDCFNLDSYGNGAITFVREIITNDVYRDIRHNFGSFRFTMLKDLVKMSTFANNSERNGRYHPYQTPAEQVCLGTYQEPYNIAMESHNFYVAYSLILQCLTVYGGDDLKGKAAGPQNPIELWTGQVCSVCDSSVQLDEISVCGKTNRVICPNCIDSTTCTDEIDGEVYHPDVLKSCSKCNKLTSTVIRKVCVGCREQALLSNL